MVKILELVKPDIASFPQSINVLGFLKGVLLLLSFADSWVNLMHSPSTTRLDISNWKVN